MTLRDDIRAELIEAKYHPLTDEEHLQVLTGYRNHYASEWYRKRISNQPYELDKQQALVLSWAIKQIASNATPYIPIEWIE